MLGEPKWSVATVSITTDQDAAMPLNHNQARKLVAAEKPGMWAARNGLNLIISVSGSTTWALRYTNKDGKRRLMKLADYEAVDAAALATLEAEAAEHRKAIRKGNDPLAERKATVTAEAVKPTGATFKDAALDFIAENRDEWKNPKHRDQWQNTLTTYVYPFIGDKHPKAITTDDVLAILRQPYARKGEKTTLWRGARETASRIRGRIETIIGAARTRAEDRDGWRTNPAQWKDHLENILKGRPTTSNFKAMDWKDAPAFMTELRGKPDISANALALTILCATRSNETFNATWHEFDLDNATWIIPAERMKAGKEHRVPLSSTAVALLKNTPKIEGNPYVFPGAKRERPLSNMAMLEMLRGMREGEGLTVHGFRSAFRDWITETTLHPDTIAEQALAHTISNKVERAYRRGDAFERRKEIMQQWTDYLTIADDEYRHKWSKFIVC